MGFLNPFLYQNRKAFTDITKGTNAIGRGNGPIKYGYNCTKGWDPATGTSTTAVLRVAVVAVSQRMPALLTPTAPQ
jgi:hypothetical protein